MVYTRVLLFVILAIKGMISSRITSHLHGYDCSSLSSYERHTLNYDDRCDTNYKSMEPEYIEGSALILSEKTTTLVLIRCEVEETVIEAYCSYGKYFTIKEGPKYIRKTNTIDLTPGMCSSMVDGKDVLYRGISISGSIRGSSSFYLSDHLDNTGFCNTWQADIEAIRVDLTIQTLKAKARISIDNKVLGFTTSSGLSVLPTGTREGKDEFGFVYSWLESAVNDVPLQSLSKETVRVTRTVSNTTSLSYPSLGINVLITGTLKIGNMSAYTCSPYNYLVLLDYKKSGLTLEETMDHDIWSNLRGVLRYTLFKNQGSSNSAVSLIKNITCQMEGELTKLHYLLSITPPETAGTILYGLKGYLVSLAGSSIIVRRCNPVQLELVNDDVCYDKWPVLVAKSGVKKFLNPFTLILENVGTEMDCRSPMLPTINIGDVPYILGPGLHPIRIINSGVSLIPKGQPDDRSIDLLTPITKSKLDQKLHDDRQAVKDQMELLSRKMAGDNKVIHHGETHSLWSQIVAGFHGGLASLPVYPWLLILTILVLWLLCRRTGGTSITMNTKTISKGIAEAEREKFFPNYLDP